MYMYIYGLTIKSHIYRWVNGKEHGKHGTLTNFIWYLNRGFLSHRATPSFHPSHWILLKCWNPWWLWGVSPFLGTPQMFEDWVFTSMLYWASILEGWKVSRFEGLLSGKASWKYGSWTFHCLLYNMTDIWKGNMFSLNHYTFSKCCSFFHADSCVLNQVSIQCLEHKPFLSNDPTIFVDSCDQQTPSVEGLARAGCVLPSRMSFPAKLPSNQFSSQSFQWKSSTPAQKLWFRGSRC
jgi:hypothetical protein